MQTKFIEVTNNDQNWGKFMLLKLDSEWEHNSAFTGKSLLREVGWCPTNIIVFDLQTGEGARFRPGGLPVADLNKHQIWVCPMYEPFLEWLYRQNLDDLSKLPDSLNLKDAPFAYRGYRRDGRGASADTQAHFSDGCRDVAGKAAGEDGDGEDGEDGAAGKDSDQ